MQLSSAYQGSGASHTVGKSTKIEEDYAPLSGSSRASGSFTCSGSGKLFGYRGWPSFIVLTKGLAFENGQRRQKNRESECPLVPIRLLAFPLLYV